MGMVVRVFRGFYEHMVEYLVRGSFMSLLMRVFGHRLFHEH